MYGDTKRSYHRLGEETVGGEVFMFTSLFILTAVLVWCAFNLAKTLYEFKTFYGTIGM